MDRVASFKISVAREKKRKKIIQYFSLENISQKVFNVKQPDKQRCSDFAEIGNQIQSTLKPVRYEFLDFFLKFMLKLNPSCGDEVDVRAGKKIKKIRTKSINL